MKISFGFQFIEIGDFRLLAVILHTTHCTAQRRQYVYKILIYKSIYKYIYLYQCHRTREQAWVRLGKAS